jgi:hypothetical protein
MCTGRSVKCFIKHQQEEWIAPPMQQLLLLLLPPFLPLPLVLFLLLVVLLSGHELLEDFNFERASPSVRERYTIYGESGLMDWKATSQHHS